MHSGLRAALFVAIGLAALTSLTGTARAEPGLVVGAVEDGVRASSLVEAESKMTLLETAGFRAVRVTSIWSPGPERAERRRARSALERLRRRHA